MVPIRASSISPTCISVQAQGQDLQWNEMIFNCTLDQFRSGIKAYEEGALIQGAFHFLTADEREFLISGLTPEQWDAIFS